MIFDRFTAFFREHIKGSWRSNALIVGVLCVAVLTFYGWRLEGDVSAFLYRPGSDVSDLTVTFWPNIAYIRRWARGHGVWPLWRTLSFCGSPFDADPQSGLWYLPNLVFFFLPPTMGFNVLLVGHTIVGGWGMWHWSRGRGTSVPGALIGALAYAFMPRVFAHLGFGHVGLVYAATYVPWALWAAQRVGRGDWRAVAMLALTLGWQFIAHPQLAFYSGLVVGGYGLTMEIGRWRSQEHRPWRFILDGGGRWALASILTVMVAAVQLVPMVRFAPLSARADLSFSESSVSSLPPRYLVGPLLADHRGFMDYALYVGLPVLVLAGIALLIQSPCRREARWWGCFVGGALIYALGTHTPLYAWIFSLLPVLSWLRAPSRIWFIAAAVMALLAGWGGDRLLRGVDGRSFRRLALGAFGFGALMLMLVLGYGLAFGRPPANMIVLGGLAPAVAGLCVIGASQKVSTWVTAGLFAVLTLADLWIVDATLVEKRSEAAVFHREEMGAFLAQRQEGEEPFRVYSPSYSLPRHIAARFELETADGVDPLYLETYADFMEVASGVRRQGYGESVPSLEGLGPVETLNRDATPDLALLSLLNVRYVAAEFPIPMEGLDEIARFDSTYLYENADVLPRAFVVPEVVPVEEFDEAMAWLKARDVRQLAHAAVVQGGRTLSSPAALNAGLTWRRITPNLLELEVSLAHPGFLVLSQAWYPDWRARIDGEPAEVWKTNGALSGVYVPSGEHSVAFAYRPHWTWVGGVVSAVTWAALVLCGPIGLPWSRE